LSCGTIVEYDGRGGKLEKRFRWILGGDRFTDDTKVIVIQIHRFVKFQIVVPKHNGHSYTYIDNVAAFSAQIKELQESLQMDHLDLESRENTLRPASRDETETSTAARADTPSGTKIPGPTADSIILTRTKLGQGSFGRADHVWDVSTGAEYAGKYFRDATTLDWLAEAEKMKSLEHVSQTLCISTSQELIDSAEYREAQRSIDKRSISWNISGIRPHGYPQTSVGASPIVCQ
jgi:serine/threonine-protein kinase Chk2